MQLKNITVHDCVEKFSDDYAAYWYFKQVFDKAKHFELTKCLKLGGGTDQNGVTELTYRSGSGNDVLLWIDGGFPVPELTIFNICADLSNDTFIPELISAFEQYHGRNFRYELTECDGRDTCRLDLYPRL